MFASTGLDRFKRLFVAVRGRGGARGVNIGFISLHKLIKNPCGQHDEDYLLGAGQKNVTQRGVSGLDSMFEGTAR